MVRRYRTEQPSADLDEQRSDAHAVSSETITPFDADALGDRRARGLPSV